MTAEIQLGSEKITLQNDQSTEFGDKKFFSQTGSTWVHPVNEEDIDFKVGAVKIKDHAVGLHTAGSLVVITADLIVKHI